MTTFTITLERDEDGFWVAECPSLPGCVTQGHTEQEALANVKEAISAYLLTLNERIRREAERDNKRAVEVLVQ